MSINRTKKGADNRVLNGFVLPPTPPKIRLSDLESTRREMAVVYRLMRSGELDTQDGTRLVYVLSQIGKLIEAASIESRINELERLAAGEQPQSQPRLLDIEENEDE